MASLKAKQDDLRRLMKERRENLKDQQNKVDSPFAKYNSLGQLFCIICNIQIKNNGLWAAHVAGKIHKENALKKKKGTTDSTSNNVPLIGEKRSEIQLPAIKKIKTTDSTSNTVPRIVEKRSEIQPPAIKKIKLSTDETSSTKLEPVKSGGKVSLLGAYPSSSEDESDPEPTASVSNNIPNNELPKDFFDAAAAPVIPVNQEQPTEKKPAPAPVNSVEALPEGFFDDPVLDAKARNIEYKDPVEEEWEKYQRAIAEETNVSKSIIEEDFEVSTLERDLAEIDLEINLWKKSEQLQTKKEEVSSKTLSNNEKNNSSGSTDDELEEDDLLDWRSKGVRKRL